MTTWTPLSGQGVEVDRQGRDEGLAFAGLHLRDLAAVKDHAADQLDVEGPHVERAAARFADDGERLRQQIVERFPLLEAQAEFRCLAAQLRVGECLDGGFEGIDLGYDRR